MKRTERHHLKDNELANLALGARRAVEGRTTLMTAALGVVIAVLLGTLGYRAWTGRGEARAQALLTESVVVEETPVGPPPAAGTPDSDPRFATERERLEAVLTKFNAVTDQYPSTDAAAIAGYKAAATLLALGRPKEAAVAYQQVVDRAPSSLYGRMARLGVAEAEAQAGEHEKAITAYKELADRNDGIVPLEGILMQLGKTYRGAGRNDDARQTFTRIVEEFPASPFSEEARLELESLKET
jgi:tetratricopeptide (TPR) repeat protein